MITVKSRIVQFSESWCDIQRWDGKKVTHRIYENLSAPSSARLRQLFEYVLKTSKLAGTGIPGILHFTWE